MFVDMKTGEVYRKNKALLSQAKEVFGDIVIAAYAGGYDWRKEDFTKRAQQYKEIKNRLDFEDFHSVVLKFKNGRLVRFQTSEWCSAREIKKEDLKII